MLWTGLARFAIVAAALRAEKAAQVISRLSMALHTKHSIRHSLNDEVYVSADLSRTMPKYRFPEPERDPRAVYAAVHDELMLDGNARQNLATFCQTWEEPELHKLMDECIDKNIVDKDEYP